jgi:ketosteroid isomerase-like protein
MFKNMISGRLQPVGAVTAVALFLCLPLRLIAQPHHRRLAHEQIQALERQWRAAMLTNDAAAMDKLLSDDYLGITPSGELLTKAQQLERMRTRDLTITTLNVSDVKIKLIGSIAIVNSLAQVDGMSEGKALTGSFRYTRVYQRLPSGAWNVTSFEATHIPRSGSRQHGGVDSGIGQR